MLSIAIGKYSNVILLFTNNYTSLYENYKTFNSLVVCLIYDEIIILLNILLADIYILYKIFKFI